MRFLLPHNYKKIGAILMPACLLFWVLLQMGVFNQLIGELHYIKVILLIVSFFSFLTGLIFLTFSKEKIEDELVKQKRLNSFQFAAFLQLILMLVGFLSILIFGDPGEGGLMLFFLAAICIFWVSFIVRFNYSLHARIKE